MVNQIGATLLQEGKVITETRLARLLLGVTSGVAINLSQF
jgi:hypothetical protein